MKALFIPLKTEYYEAFCDGSKEWEYRVYGPRWNERTCYIGRPAVISKGYGKQARRTGTVAEFKVEFLPTTTAAWRDCYGDKGGLAACIRIRLNDGPMAEGS